MLLRAWEAMEVATSEAVVLSLLLLLYSRCTRCFSPWQSGEGKARQGLALQERNFSLHSDATAPSCRAAFRQAR